MKSWFLMDGLSNLKTVTLVNNLRLIISPLKTN